MGTNKLKPGRDLDALVAEKVMGLIRGRDGNWLEPAKDVVRYYSDNHPNSDYSNDDFYLPDYSTDIAAAWEVVEKMEGQNFYSNLYSYFQATTAIKLWGAAFEVVGRTSKPVFGESAPHAICLAALKACGVEFADKGSGVTEEMLKP